MQLRSVIIAVCTTLAASQLGTQGAQTYTFQEGVNGYAGTKDTHIRFGSPDRDDGALDSLNPDKSDGGGEVHAFMRFDDIFGTKPNQIPPGSTILTATLTLYFVDPGNSPSMHRILKPWDESTTWNTWDPISQDGITADGIEAAIDPDVKFDVPSGTPYYKVVELPAKTFQDWLDGKSPNHGWGFIPDSTNGVDFDSSEGAVPEQRPKLTIVVGTAGDAFVKEFVSSPTGFRFVIEDGTRANGQANPINAASISVSFDGAKVTHQVTKAGTASTISYSPPSYLASGSAHTVVLSFADSGTPPKTQTVEQKFTAPLFPTLPSSYAVTGVDTSKPGFKARVNQIGATRPGGDQNNHNSAERQLAGAIINPDTAKPYENEADLTQAKAGIFELQGTINWNQDAPAAIGNFSDTSTPAVTDQPIPGIPGINGGADNIAAEITTFLDLKAGFYRFGVNSDDGFKVTAGPSPSDVFATKLGSFDTGRGSADSFFDFAVEKDGMYPFRLAWWEGGGGANLEFFSVDSTGQKILINDTSNAKAIKAYRDGPTAPFAPRTGVQVLVAIDDKTMWRYDQSGKDLGTAWREKSFNDASWPQGAALLGDETNVAEPIRTPLERTTAGGEYVETFYMRTHFNFTGDPKAVQLKLRHVVDDGAIFYLNGVEVHRFGYAAGVTVAFDNSSAISHENEWEGPYDISNASLVAGDNVLAVEVHQNGTGSSDIVFGAELQALTGAAPPPVGAPKIGSVARTAGNITIEWSGTAALQSADSVTGPWTEVANAKSPFTATASGGAKFYRLKQ